MDAQDVGTFEKYSPDWVRPSFVYLVGYRPHPELLFLKAGKSDNPKKRGCHIGGMVPGGLDFMYAAELSDSEAAYTAEFRLMEWLASLDGVTAISGEWFKCEPRALDEAISFLRLVNPNFFSLPMQAPAAFGVKRKLGNESASRAALWRAVMAIESQACADG